MVMSNKNGEVLAERNKGVIGNGRSVSNGNVKS